MSNSIRTVNIYGRSYAPLLAAVFLKIKIQHLEIKVWWDNCDDEGVELSLSTSSLFHRLLGLSDATFFKSVAAKKSLGIAFCHEAYTRFFSDVGLNQRHKSLSSLQCWALDKSTSVEDVSLESYQLPALILKKQTDEGLTGPLKKVGLDIESGYIVDTASYANFLISQCKGLGISLVDSSVSFTKNTFQNLPDTPGVMNILTHPIIPLSESESILGYEVGCESMDGDSSDCDILGMSLKINDGNLVKALSLQGSTNSSKFVPEVSGCNQKFFRCRRDAWSERFVHLGASAIELPNLIFSYSYVLQSQLVKLLDIWPSEQSLSNSAKIFNTELETTFRRIGEIEMGVFSRAFGASWYESSSMLKQFQYRSALFNHVCHIPEYDHDIFSKEIWASLLWGLGFSPNNIGAELSQKSHQDFRDAKASLKFKIPD